MPLYQVELFRTVQDQATVTVSAASSQEAQALAGQQINDLEWYVVDEDITFDTTTTTRLANGYTSMASILAQSNVSPDASTYTPLVNR